MRTPIAAVLALLVIPSVAWTQDDDSHKKMIYSALSAAPAAVAEGAKVMTMAGEVLREGDNGFTCFPDDPNVPNNSAMCVDANWLEVLDAWMNKREPNYSGIGISYMLQGDMPVSNIDPFATGPTDNNQWIQVGKPHIMVAVSDHSALEGLSTDPDNGGPFVMWKGTPYAHIMIPTVPRD